MSLAFQFEISVLIVIAAILSMLIGLDRERRKRSAGLRTHMLVGVGACLFTLLSRFAFTDSDPSRVASNIVTGIGFLGAGTIIRRQHDAHDLTTAAGIWATAAVGMTVGTGAWLLAAISTIIIWVILAGIRRFEPKKPEQDEKACT